MCFVFEFLFLALIAGLLPIPRQKLNIPTRIPRVTRPFGKLA